jgi:hypothetical protein
MIIQTNGVFRIRQTDQVFHTTYTNLEYQPGSTGSIYGTSRWECLCIPPHAMRPTSPNPSPMFPVPRNAESCFDLLTFSDKQKVTTTRSRIPEPRSSSTSFAGIISEVGGIVSVCVTRLRLMNFAIGALSLAPS